MKWVTYLIYILSFELIVWGGTFYMVVMKGYSPLWFLGAILLSSCAYTPARWFGGPRE